MWSSPPLERRFPSGHPLRPLRATINGVLQERSSQFDPLHFFKVCRSTFPPEQPHMVLLLQALTRVRSERPFVDHRGYKLPSGRFIALVMDDSIPDVTVFTTDHTLIAEHQARGNAADEAGLRRGRATRLDRPETFWPHAAHGGAPGASAC